MRDVQALAVPQSRFAYRASRPAIGDMMRIVVAPPWAGRGFRAELPARPDHVILCPADHRRDAGRGLCPAGCCCPTIRAGALSGTSIRRRTSPNSCRRRPSVSCRSVDRAAPRHSPCASRAIRLPRRRAVQAESLDGECRTGVYRGNTALTSGDRAERRCRPSSPAVHIPGDPGATVAGIWQKACLPDA